jgi:CBS domain containing-hemolysin-like protein
VSAPWGGLHVAAGLVAAGLCLLVELALSAVLVAVASLSRVTLHRIAASAASQLSFLAALQHAPSTHRSALILSRQLSLLAAVLLLMLTARGAGWPHPELIGLGGGMLVGVVLLETVVARFLALRYPRQVLSGSAFLVRTVHLLLYPLVRPLVLLLSRVAQTERSEEEREEQQEQEVEALIEVGEREGLLEAEEGKMMRGIVDLDETLVREIMTPQADIVALPEDTTVAEARRKLLESAHSRLPLYRGSIDNVTGMLHARDLFQAWEAQEERHPVARYARPATFVPETLTAAELLAAMRLKTQLAMVVDDYGAISGLVTLEDLLEEIVGEIRDEHDQGEEEEVQREAEGSYLIRAAAHVEELERLFGVEFKDRDFDTVGGLIVRSFGRVPASGERLTLDGLAFEVLEADRRRVHRVRVRALPPAAGARVER